MTLRVSIRHENAVVCPRARRYTQGGTDQTTVFLECSEPVKECAVRDREVVSLVAPSLGSTHRRLSCMTVPDRCRRTSA